MNLAHQKSEGVSRLTGSPASRIHLKMLQAWSEPSGEPSQEELFLKRIGEWHNALGEFNKVANSELYENENFRNVDLLYHLMFASELILDAQQILLEAAFGAEPTQSLKSKFHELSSSVTELVDRIHEWHGSANSQPDIPESFKQSMKEAAEGNLIDLQAVLDGEEDK